MLLQDLKSDITEIRRSINELHNPCKYNGNDPRYEPYKILNNTCYKFVEEKNSYDMAKSYCENDSHGTGKVIDTN